MAASDILKRPYARLVMPDEDGTFTAEIVEFSGCIAVGPTPSEALSSLEEVAVDWINAAIEQGQNIPDPLDSTGYSGKLVLRMPKGLHRKAALLAEREGVSLNQFIVTCLAETVGERAKPQALQPQFQAEARMIVQLVSTPGAVTGLPAVTQATRSRIPTSGPAFTIPALRESEPEHA